MHVQTYRLDTSNGVRLVLEDGESGDPINDATVQVTGKNLAGVNLAGEAWPLSIPYVGGTDGVYRKAINAALGVTQDQVFRLHVTVTASGHTRGWQLVCVATVDDGTGINQERLWRLARDQGALQQ